MASHIQKLRKMFTQHHPQQEVIMSNESSAAKPPPKINFVFRKPVSGQKETSSTNDGPASSNSIAQDVAKELKNAQ